MWLLTGSGKLYCPEPHADSLPHVGGVLPVISFTQAMHKLGHYRSYTCQFSITPGVSRESLNSNFCAVELPVNDGRSLTPQHLPSLLQQPLLNSPSCTNICFQRQGTPHSKGKLTTKLTANSSGLQTC